MAIMNRRPMRGGRPMPAPATNKEGMLKVPPVAMRVPPKSSAGPSMPPPPMRSPAGPSMPPPDMVNRSPGAPSGDMAGMGRAGGNMPPPVNRPAVMPGNGMPVGGNSVNVDRSLAVKGPPSNNMPMGAMGGAMGPKPFAKGGKVSSKAPVKAKAKSTCMKTGGSVKSSASSRGDGCAQRGRTRGKYC